MRIDRWRRADAATAVNHPPGVAIVIDVLRATSTAVVLLSRVPEVCVVAGLDAIAALPPRPYLIVSELDGADAFGPRIDNSPVEAGRVPLDGRMPVLVTTNGTRALCAAAESAEHVVAASFLNLGAVAAAVAALAPAQVTLLPAGDFTGGVPHAEDERCADALAALLRGERPDFPSLLAAARADARIERRLAREPGLAADLDLALSVDRFGVVPRFERRDAHGGRLCAWR